MTISGNIWHSSFDTPVCLLVFWPIDHLASECVQAVPLVLLINGKLRQSINRTERAVHRQTLFATCAFTWSCPFCRFPFRSSRRFRMLRTLLRSHSHNHNHNPPHFVSLFFREILQSLRNDPNAFGHYLMISRFQQSFSQIKLANVLMTVENSRPLLFDSIFFVMSQSKTVGQNDQRRNAVGQYFLTSLVLHTCGQIKLAKVLMTVELQLANTFWLWIHHSAAVKNSWPKWPASKYDVSSQYFLILRFCLFTVKLSWPILFDCVLITILKSRTVGQNDQHRNAIGQYFLISHFKHACCQIKLAKLKLQSINHFFISLKRVAKKLLTQSVILDSVPPAN